MTLVIWTQKVHSAWCFSMQHRVEEWVRQFGGIYVEPTENQPTCVAFSNPEDALVFKLKFGV